MPIFLTALRKPHFCDHFRPRTEQVCIAEIALVSNAAVGEVHDNFATQHYTKHCNIKSNMKKSSLTQALVMDFSLACICYVIWVVFSNIKFTNLSKHKCC